MATEEKTRPDNLSELCQRLGVNLHWIPDLREGQARVVASFGGMTFRRDVVNLNGGGYFESVARIENELVRSQTVAKAVDEVIGDTLSIWVEAGY